MIDEKGARHVYCLRRLRCRRCGKLHTELPNFIVPYKRYGAQVIVSVSEGGKANVPCEERTTQKIRAWYKRVTGHLQGVWRQQVNLGFVSPHGGVERAKRVMLMREISEREGVSERTLRRWLFSYEHESY